MYLCSTVDQVSGVSGFAALDWPLTSWDVSWDGFSLCHLVSHPQAGLTRLVLRECQDFKRGSRGMQGSLAGEAQHFLTVLLGKVHYKTTQIQVVKGQTPPLDGRSCKQGEYRKGNNCSHFAKKKKKEIYQ